MTTIAYRNGVLVADSAVFDRGTYCGQMRKITRAPDGTIGGAAGAVGECARFRDWMLSGPEGDPPKIEFGDSECIYIRPDGSVWWVGQNSLPTQIYGDYFAIGSGFKMATGAMAAGASAERAVEICADLDNMTRRPLHVERLQLAMLEAAE